MNLNNLKYNIGDKTIIIGNSNGHGFWIGEPVTIVALPEDEEDGYECVGSKSQDGWFVLEEEMAPAERTFTKTEVWEIAKKAMNMGMDLRQDQLQGHGGDKSGDELLKEYLDKL